MGCSTGLVRLQLPCSNLQVEVLNFAPNAKALVGIAKDWIVAGDVGTVEDRRRLRYHVRSGNEIGTSAQALETVCGV